MAACRGFPAYCVRYPPLLSFTKLQISQSIVCNQHHSLQQQLCRWLLMCADRSASMELPLTLGFIGDMLGSRRTAMSLAIGHLQQQGAIRHSRGKLTLLD